MTKPSKIFRIFVSSTFDDLMAERNALQEHVFPKLRELCMQLGCRFQAIDLRWGVSEEASLDQQTITICLQELRRCQEMTPRPNLIILLGDRYGWCPLPPQIKAEEFDEILSTVSDKDKELLLWNIQPPDNKRGWYRRDDNAVPPEYCLRPRREDEDWKQIEKKLRSIILSTINNLGWQKDDSRRFKYEASATHQEIQQVVFEPKNPEGTVFCFFRKIEGMSQGECVKNFIDLDGDGNPDKDARTRLDTLKKALHDYRSVKISEYEVKCDTEKDFNNYLAKLCDDVYKSLERVINAEITTFKKLDVLDHEIESHESFGKERSRFFTGRVDILKVIRDYLTQANPHLLAISGAPGSGKTALMAKAVEECRLQNANSVVVSRFIGATPSSSDGRSLLENLCRQISRSW